MADREAARLDRPRSWVVAEAVRRYGRVPESSVALPRGSDEVAAARQEHLLADLRRSPEERLQRAMALLRLAPRRATRRAQVIGFDSYEDFCEWKQANLIEGLARDRRLPRSAKL